MAAMVSHTNILLVIPDMRKNCVMHFNLYCIKCNACNDLFISSSISSKVAPSAAVNLIISHHLGQPPATFF